MIRVRRPGAVPKALAVAGLRARDTLCKQYDAGERIFKFRPAIYAAPEVRKSLRDAQYGKCAFCEIALRTGCVEHFRPKGGIQETARDPVAGSGYYWLAYSWDNLLLSCNDCNNRKGSLFPLINPEKRAMHHGYDVADEQPTLINPAVDDPAEFLDFRDEYVSAIDGNARGQATIDILDLNGNDLSENRL